MNKIRSPLFDEPIKINLDMFRGLKPEQISCWSEVELYCALNGFEVDENVFNFMLLGMQIYANIYDMFIVSLQQPGFLDPLVNRLETLEVIYKLTDPDSLDNVWYSDWTKAFGANVHNDPSSRCFIDQTEMDPLEYKYRLFSVIDNRFPTLLVRFYDKHKRMLHQYDEDFIRFLFRRMKFKAKHNEIFRQIYETMEAERQKMLKVSMFMN